MGKFKNTKTSQFTKEMAEREVSSFLNLNLNGLQQRNSNKCIGAPLSVCRRESQINSAR